MGNWHCLTSSCAQVVYREYESPKIRWRYGNEAWQEIIGADDYSTEIIPDLSQNTTYEIVYRYIQGISNGQIIWSPEGVIGAIPLNGIESWYLGVQWNKQGGPAFYDRLPPLARFSVYVESGNSIPAPAYRTAYFSLKGISQGQSFSRSITSGMDIWFVRLQARDPAKRKNVCVFKVFKNGQIVYQETRSVCPEVNKISCQLSTTEKQIEIKKLPYLSVVEVIPYGISSQKVPDVPYPLPTVFPIPNQCLNIYKNDLLNFLPDSTNAPNDPVFGDFVAQICSASGCPPPEYQVICDCHNCESCPPDTCAVECEGQVCCYGSDGVSLRAIDLGNYCGGNL